MYDDDYITYADNRSVNIQSDRTLKNKLKTDGIIIRLANAQIRENYLDSIEIFLTSITQPCLSSTLLGI